MKIKRMERFRDQWLVFVLLALLSASVFAEDDADSCGLPIIQRAFKQYLQNVVQADVLRIQSRLNELGYGPIAQDAILGRDTRLALQKFCRSQSVTETDDTIAGTLVELLYKTSATARDTEIPLAPVSPAPQATIPLNEVSGPAVFYRWSAPEEQEADNSAAPTVEGDTQAAPDNALPDEVINRLSIIEGVAYPSQALFKQALFVLFDKPDLEYRPYEADILAQARNGPVEKFARIQLSGGGCGCSREFSSMVYGFYPYWLAQEGTVQTVDFSLFDRIGFYALSLDQEGNIQNRLQWSNAWNMADFINKAHKHEVDLDLAIYVSGWQNWTEQVMAKAAGVVAKAASEKFSTTGNPPQGHLALLEKSSTTWANGVTLVFEDYGKNTSAVVNVVSFVGKLEKNLAAVGQGLKINIMLDLDATALSGQQALFNTLETILLRGNAASAVVEHVLVFLPESTSKSKKQLRQKIENEFRGADRQQVLRKIVAVISPVGLNNDPQDEVDQFMDDLIYFQDNFAGVGLWPLPLDTDDGVQTIKTTIIDLYSGGDGTNRLGEMIDALVPELCQFVCPNRWLFRLSFDLLAGLLVLYAVLAIGICRLRRLYRQYFAYFLAVGLTTLLIMLVSLVCDPYWEERADLVVVLVGLVLGAYAVWKFVSKLTRPPLP